MQIEHWWCRHMALLHVFLQPAGIRFYMSQNVWHEFNNIITPIFLQVFLLKPWLIFFSMMAFDINYVRVFIIQIYVQPKRNCRAGTHMVAIIFMAGTKYVYNLDKKGIKYSCNLKSETDHLCLQSLSIKTKYACNHRNHSHVTLGRFSTLQA